MSIAYEDDSLIMISALNQFMYCERRCALIHIEQIWGENNFTAEGHVFHERADSGQHEKRKDHKIVCSLRLRSLRLGLTGQADVVEFNKLPEGTWIPFPVEYKRGHAKGNDCDRIQLCAQALCLEEMLSCHIQVGALFYGETRRRCEVVFDEALRQQTEAVCHRLHELMKAGITPPAVYNKGKCTHCSLLELCLPQSVGKERSAQRWLDRQIEVICPTDATESTRP